MEPNAKPVLPPRKGRGAVSNTESQRFNLPTKETDGEWLDRLHIAQIADLESDDFKGVESPEKLRTNVTVEHPRSILSFNKSPDIPFDRSINAYRGCEHGCVYCFARPTHAYHDLSPGLDFETELFAKPSAAALLRATLAKPTYRPAPIAIGTNTDPYQPIEKRYKITRDILEVMIETKHPIGITTKSDRVLDDIDLLAQLAADKLTIVAISVTTLDTRTARLLEPRAPAPAKRLEAVRRLQEAGIPVHVNIAPIIPAITDHEIEAIIAKAAEYGARSVSSIPLRLPHEVAPLFEEWLEAHFPDRRQKVMHIIRDMRGGKRNDPNFHSRMKGSGPWAELLRARMTIARHKNGLEKGKFALRSDLFQRPIVQGSQMELF